MADWFKFYENTIDEPALSSAIAELPEVLGVLVLLRAEHCRRKSNTLKWNSDDYAMRGLARKINCPMDKFTTALSLLMRINYYEIKNGQLIDLLWDENQSDYCQRKTRLQNQGNRTKSTDSDRTPSAHPPHTVPQEERREEDKRKEESTTPPASVPDPARNAPTSGRKPRDLAECLAKAAFVGMTEPDARNWYRDCEACDWKRGDGTPFDNWTRQMTLKRDKLAEQRQQKGQTGTGQISPTAEIILRQNELKRVEERVRVIRASYSENLDYEEKDRLELVKLKARKKELLTLLGMPV